MPPDESWKKFFYFLIFIFLIIFHYVEFVCSLYSTIDLAKIDLLKAKEDTKLNHLLYILKNNDVFYTSLSITQSFFSTIISSLAALLPEDFTFFSTLASAFLISLILTCLQITIKFFAEKNNEKLVLNSWIIHSSYFITKISFPFLFFFFKPKKKLFANTEKDFMRLIKNLTTENIIEKSEAELVNAAFSFDETYVKEIFIPRKKVIVINENMTWKEVEKVYLKYRFSCFPVINEEKKFSGIFNCKDFTFQLIKKRKDWQNFIDKKIIYVEANTTLSDACNLIKKDINHLALVKEKKKVIEIIPEHPLLINRAPTLHKQSLLSAYPVAVKGNVINLHPLITTGLNADFDGDQMPVHLPLTPQAIKEAKTCMLTSNNILDPKNGSLITLFAKDSI